MFVMLVNFFLIITRVLGKNQIKNNMILLIMMMKMMVIMMLFMEMETILMSSLILN